MQQFGGDWTKNKINILVEYAHAYLTIMKVMAGRYDWKLLYFDGFAGSGLVEKEGRYSRNITVGAATRIVELDDPRPFDKYVFVEKNRANTQLLEQRTKNNQPNKDIIVQQADCNERLLAMAKFLRGKGKNYKVLAYIDPYGMQLEWSSIEALKGLSIDMWILVPTGMGVNRLLKNNGDLSTAWLNRLTKFLGMEEKEILGFFYTERTVPTLFGDENILQKEEKAIEKSAELYQERLRIIFRYVTNPFVLRTKSRSVLYHFFMASNNQNAVRIANDVIRKYNRIS